MRTAMIVQFPCRLARSMPAFARLGLVALIAIALPACKVVVSVPFGGKVVSEDGFECVAGETCVIDVSDDTFDSTFTAAPAAGYSFIRWRRKPSALCGDRTIPCYLSTTGFTGNSGLLSILASDQEFFLEPVFIHYDLTYWKQVLTEIESGNFTTDSFLYALRPDTANCDPGALTGPAKGRALTALNQTRALHHLPPVTRDGFYDMQVQEASLVQKANNYLNHTPAPGDSCYTAGALDGASTSNLHAGSQTSDPAGDVFGWTNDNNNVAALMEAGHRRWNLFPDLGYTSYGQVEGFSALKVFGFGSPPTGPVPPALEFVAMPYKTYPYILVSKGASPTPWSFSIVPPSGQASSFNYFQTATVSVTDYETGQPLPVQDLHRDSKAFGLANFLSWMVAGWDHDKIYTVRINGIRIPGGEVRDIEYPVVIDRYHLFNVSHPLESTDSKQGMTLQGKFNSGADNDSYKINLAGNKTLAGQSEFSNQGFFILVYDADKRLVKSSDKAFTRSFPLGTYTIVVSHCDENSLCYQGTQSYRVTVN